MNKEWQANLSAAYAGFIRVPPPDNPPVDGFAWSRKHGLEVGIVDPLTGENFGFGAAGRAAVHRLALQMLDADAEFQRGADTKTFVATVESTAIALFRHMDGALDPPAALSNLQLRVTAWFRSSTPPQDYYIPCSIILDKAASFRVGPVRFTHAEDFLAERVADLQDPLSRHAFEQLFDFMNERHGRWIADVTVAGCEPVRANEMANLGVDLALVAVQLAVPLNYSRNMARVAGKTVPPRFSTVHRVGKQVFAGSTSAFPGYGFMGSALAEVVAASQAFFDSVGHRVCHYLSGSGFPKLEQAWCDSAYWYHEGLSEPIDTIAVTKLATSLEILLAAGSTKNSSKRLREAFLAFFGLGENDPIGTSGVTVNSYVKHLVRHRSTVLHGTSSTLKPEERVPRFDLEIVGWELLRRSTYALDLYAASADARDDPKAFLQWITANR
jgi:hypothetical protein